MLPLCAACPAQERVTLLYKARQGQVMRYKSEAALTMEAGGMKVSLEVKEVEKVTVQEVAANGSITRESETESSEYSVNGNKLPEREDKNRTSITLSPRGMLVALKRSGDDKTESKEQARFAAASLPVFSEQPVGVGDRWSTDYKADAEIGTRAAHADYEVLAFERASGVDAVKLKVRYKETEAHPPLAVEGIVWVEKSTGDTVLRDVALENLTFGAGPMSVQASGKLHEERTEGSPLPAAGAAPAAGEKKTDTKPEPKKDKTIDDIVKEYEKLPGLFTLYRKKESGRETLYMEIKEEQLDHLLMLEVTASTGTASQIVAGDPINDIVFKLTRVGDDKLYVVKPNTDFVAAAKTPIGRATRRSFADAYLETFKIEAKQPDRKSLLVNVSELFRGDFAEISQRVNGPRLGPLGGGGSYSLDREKSFVTSVKVFPENVVVQSAYHFTRSGGGGLAGFPGAGGSTLADPRSMPFNVIYNLFPLPEQGYRPRLADGRVGYFVVDYQDLTSDARDDQTVHHIYRWKLEKADPRQVVSPPREPIVFWLDNAIPLEYRDAVREGLLMWNKAFEKIGLKEAIQVQQMPDDADWDHADMRHNTIRWVASPSNAYAVAQARVNPITGQILNANITVDANLIRFTKSERNHLVDPASCFEDPAPSASALHRCELGAGAVEQAWYGHLALSLLAGAGGKLDERAYTHAFLRSIVAHEFGHILGLRHNFSASTVHSLEELKDQKILGETGISASVMDYIPFNIAALKQHGVDYWTSTLGAYDFWAIQYGYTPIDATTPEGERYRLNQIASRDNLPGHAYQSDEIADQFDPAVTRFDLGKDPLDYWARTLQVTRHLLLHLNERSPRKGESYWEFTRNFNALLGQYARAAAIASRYVGGLHARRNYRGDYGEKPVLTPVDTAQQRRAVRLLNTYLFAPNSFAFPTNYFTRMTGDPLGGFVAMLSGGPQDFPIRDSLSAIQQAALRRLFSASVLKRMVNNEFKSGEGADVLSLPELYQGVRKVIWSELDSRHNVSALRRQLQRAHLETLIGQLLSPAAGTPEDARMMAWDELRQMQQRLARAKGHETDTYTRIHFDESRMRITRALEARQTIGGPAPPAPNLLQMLLGGETPGKTR